jgi:hypothetical protein
MILELTKVTFGALFEQFFSFITFLVLIIEEDDEKEGRE